MHDLTHKSCSALPSEFIQWKVEKQFVLLAIEDLLPRPYKINPTNLKNVNSPIMENVNSPIMEMATTGDGNGNHQEINDQYAKSKIIQKMP